MVHRAPILLPLLRLSTTLGRLCWANHVGKVTHMLFQLHSLLSTSQVLAILLVATKIPCESNAWIKCYGAIWISETTIACCAVRVATRTVSLVPDALRHLVGRSKLFPGQNVRRLINIREELRWLVLCSWWIHGIVSSIIVIDVSVTTGAILMVSETLPVLGEICDCGLFWSLTGAKLAMASLVLIYCKHDFGVDQIGKM